MRQIYGWADVRELASVLEKRKAHKATGSIVAARFVAANAILNAAGNPNFIRQILDRTEGAVPNELHVQQRRIHFEFNLGGQVQHTSVSTQMTIPTPSAACEIEACGESGALERGLPMNNGFGIG